MQPGLRTPGLEERSGAAKNSKRLVQLNPAIHSRGDHPGLNAEAVRCPLCQGPGINQGSLLMGKGDISQINSVCVCVCTQTHKRGKAQKEKNKDYMSLDMVWNIMEGSMRDAEGETRGF